MSFVRQSDLTNRILRRLSQQDFELLGESLESIDCKLGETLIAPGELMTRVFFLEAGIASIVVIGADGNEIEGGVVGREGFVAPEAALGADKILQRIEVQMAGTGNSVAMIAFQHALAASPSFRDKAQRFMRVMLVQNAYTVLSNSIHTVSERLSRWLLMCDDRCDASDLHLTHKFLSVMLAVRRASVTEAVQLLEARGLIHSERRYIAIRDRVALEAYAGDAYGNPEGEYRRLLGPM